MKIETFYTGGGIWLSQYDAGGGYYAVVSSDHPDCLSIYRKTDDQDEAYLPETSSTQSKRQYTLSSQKH